MKKIRMIGLTALALLWAILTCAAWFGPAEDFSNTERRMLAQFPKLTTKTVLNGKFMTEFEGYSLDQFPLRDSFRQLKAIFHYNALGQKDNNDIYITDDYAAKLEYPLNETSVSNAVKKFNHLYEKYLTGSENIVVSIVPDKGYYLGQQSGHLTMDYEAMFDAFAENMTWAEFVDITGSLDGADYYRTDTHWRQENLLDAAGKLCETLGATAPKAEDYTAAALERPFYGVYYGQAALPMEPERNTSYRSRLVSFSRLYTSVYLPLS